MKKKISVLILSVFLLQFGVTYANESYEPPLETAILKFPDNSEGNWKEITRYVNKVEGVVETIPLDQTLSNWSESICVQYIDVLEGNKKAPHSLANLLKRVRMGSIARHLGNEVTWNILEDNKDDIIYEWILQKPYKDTPAEHEISRAFLTKTGFHRIGFTRRYGQMDPKEREKWIKLLRENVSVIAFEEGDNSEGLSLVSKLKDYVVLGPNFQNWSMINTFSSEYGVTNICYNPSTQVDQKISENLDFIIMPNTRDLSFDQFFAMEKKFIQDGAQKKIEFRVLEESPSEVIYTYSCRADHLQRNAVVRATLTDYGYYSINYYRNLDGHMNEEEILNWKEKLKSICIKKPLS